MCRRVLIVDDHAAYRAAVAAVLEHAGFVVVGAVGDGESAIVEAERLRPDVLLVDVQLPGIDGFEVANRVGLAAHPPAVVLMSSRDPSSYGARLDVSSAQGFIAKRALTGDTLAALLG